MALATFWFRMAYAKGDARAKFWLDKHNMHIRAPEEQAFIKRIETSGPDRSSLSNFNYEVSVYCQYGGKRCNELRGQGFKLQEQANARAEAENTRRLWDVYRRESVDPLIRAKCLAKATESLHKATYGQQSWYYSAENC